MLRVIVCRFGEIMDTDDTVKHACRSWRKQLREDAIKALAAYDKTKETDDNTR